METLPLKSQTEYELIDITHLVQDAISKSGVKSGLVLVFIPHTTAGIICNENEANLKSDILKVLKALDDHSNFFGSFGHDRNEGLPARQAGNAHAHIAVALSGSSRSFIFEDGRLRLGAWQSIMFLEMDGPRNREIWIKIIPDSP